MRNFKPFSALLLTLLLACAVTAEDRDKDDTKPKIKLPKFEEAIGRAFIRARKIDDLKLCRISMITQDLLDETQLVAFFEFGTGDIGMFQGGREPTEDNWVFVDKKNLDLLAEVTKRCQNR